MAPPALDLARQALLDETRRLVAEVASRLEGLGVAEATRRALADSREQLALPFLLVVVGEFNAGKSAFINALLGQKALDEGVTPTTARIGVLRHGEREERRAIAPGVDTLTTPAEILRTLAIVDTPGTNAVGHEHEALTRDYVPRADLVLSIFWRPFTTRGAQASMIAGTLSALVLIFLSPTIQVGVLGHASAPFPLKNPGLVTIPLAFLVAIVVSLLAPEREASERFPEVQRRVHLGPEAEVI